jgi:hypothetical protein
MLSRISQAERDNYLRWDGRQAGFYEVYFLKVNDPVSRVGFWLRYTLTAPNAGPPRAEVYGVMFDPSRRHPLGFKDTHPVWRMGLHGRHFRFPIGENVLTHRSAIGFAGPSEGGMQWALTWEPNETGIRYYGYDWLYRIGWPKTKALTPNPAIRMTGTVIVGDERFDLVNAPAQQGHIWGVRHAERWAWGHCCAFAEDADAVFEGLTASPDGGRDLSTFFIRLDGRDFAFNQVADFLFTESRYTLESWTFRLEQDGYRFEGTLTAPKGRIIGVTHRSVDDSLRICNNTMIADCRIVVSRSADGRTWLPYKVLTCQGMAAMETVGRNPHPQVPVRL